jgi:hypothetical protein
MGFPKCDSNHGWFDPVPSEDEKQTWVCYWGLWRDENVSSILTEICGIYYDKRAEMQDSAFFI